MGSSIFLNSMLCSGKMFVNDGQPAVFFFGFEVLFLAEMLKLHRKSK